jgi:hypothetical protein
VALFELAHTVIELSTLYFCQRRPRELSKFHWVIDAKDRDRVTNWEEWWSRIVMPMIQSSALRKPFGQLVGGDYSHFERFYREIPDYLMPYVNEPTKKMGLNANLIMKESFRFSSKPEPGLELVDIVSNALRRALIKNLDFQGWHELPRLMINRRDGHCIRFIRLENEDESHHYPYGRVLRHFRQGGKSMLAPRFNRSKND